MTVRPKRIRFFAVISVVLGIAGIAFFFLLLSLELVFGFSSAYTWFQLGNLSLFVLVLVSGVCLWSGARVALLLNRLYAYGGLGFSLVVILYLSVHFGTEFFGFFGLIFLGAIWHTAMLYPALVLAFLAHSRSVREYLAPTA